MNSKVTGGGLIVRETACKYLRTSLKSVQNAGKMRVWETASTPLLAFRHGLCSELPLFCLAGVMSNLAFIFKEMWKLKVSHPSLLRYYSDYPICMTEADLKNAKRWPLVQIATLGPLGQSPQPILVNEKFSKPDAGHILGQGAI